MDCTDHIGQCLGVEFVTHLGQLRTLGKIDLTEEAKATAGVILDTEEIIVLDVRQVMTKFGMPFLLCVFLTESLGLHIVQRKRQTDL